MVDLVPGDNTGVQGVEYGCAGRAVRSTGDRKGSPLLAAMGESHIRFANAKPPHEIEICIYS